MFLTYFIVFAQFSALLTITYYFFVPDCFRWVISMLPVVYLDVLAWILNKMKVPSELYNNRMSENTKRSFKQKNLRPDNWKEASNLIQK